MWGMARRGSQENETHPLTEGTQPRRLGHVGAAAMLWEISRRQPIDSPAMATQPFWARALVVAAAPICTKLWDVFLMY